ncbi:MAG: putative signal transducing protein [Panacagrimonas sp.]
MPDPIYLAADPVEAEIVRNLLGCEHIECDIFGAMLWGGRGEIAADPYPRLVLRDPRDEARARELLREYREGSLRPAWTCGCGESVPGNFAACWSCGVGL